MGESFNLQMWQEWMLTESGLKPDEAIIAHHPTSVGSPWHVFTINDGKIIELFHGSSSKCTDCIEWIEQQSTYKFTKGQLDWIFFLRNKRWPDE